MLTVGIILCYLLGLSLMSLVSRKYTVAEAVGYSFLIGMLVETFFLFVLDVVGIQYSQSILVGLNMLVIAAAIGLNYKNRHTFKYDFKTLDIGIKNINLPAIFIFFFIVYLFYGITTKCLFWPPTEHDTIGSFDKLGRIMALEGKLKISLFQYDLQGAGGLYPPLYHGSFAYVYIFGAEMPKIITTLFFLSLLTTFYSAVRNFVGSTAAMLATIFLMLTPELFSHAALSLGNLPTTAYVCGAVLATITWLEKSDDKYFWLGAICMAGVIWIRSDTIVFIAAALLVLGIYFLRTRNFKQPFIYSVIAVAPFIIWNLYLKLKIGVAQAGKFDLGIGYNTERMDVVGGYVKAFLLGNVKGGVDGGQLYGLVFVLFFLLLAVNLVLIGLSIAKVYKADTKEVANTGLNTLLFFLVSFALYFAVFYFINEKVQNAPIASLMESSFKRGMFFFVPLVVFYTFTNHLSTRAFNLLEGFRKGE
ncbi:MAG TPA: glycosyltransferase family 39 protein [Chitinophagales bacterium]|nr:glycosyltransferase family 39 protein [Chitinophagales bacterium]